LVNDQRIFKVCNTLKELDYDILLIGRKLSDNSPLSRDYKTYRMRLLFSNGFLFYIEYSMRLFFKILFTKKDILLSNDLDTLLPNYLISIIQHKKLVYDSHELFTEIPELIHRPIVQNIWLKIEQYIFPKLKNVYTVNREIAEIYSEKYNVKVGVIRNIAYKLKNKKGDVNFADKIKGNSKMLILQGTGINIDRGAEEAVEMMQYLENTILYIIGSGDVFDKLESMASELKLENKVFILDKIPYSELIEYTKIADLGLSLDKNTNLNYEYSLPNKIFDYIQSSTPILTSNRVVVAEIVNTYNIGKVVDSHDPKIMASVVQSIFENQEGYNIWKENLQIASEKFNWENESEKLKQIYSNLK
jgi:glycosyltransferase involved in cell wall biosynthesis